jgi:CPA2 family monovalent cation:H+ antiporter-2
LAFATDLAGLSYALGAFIAGMLISETRYRYQVESDIASFRDILMGLFFISVGMLLDFNYLINNIALVSALLLAFVLFKAVVVAVLVRFFGFEWGVGIRTGVILAQAGEFGFVILTLALGGGLIGGAELQLVLSACLLSMITAPFVIQYNGRIARRLAKSYMMNISRKEVELEGVGKMLRGHVILCGYGRSGQYLGRFFKEENIPFVALDIDPTRVQEAAAAGENVMYGDASRSAVLAAAGAGHAKALIISYAGMRSTMKILHLAKENHPNLPVVVRTADETHMEEFRKAGAAEVVPEVLEGSLMLASHALIILGVPLNRVVKRIRLFREERYQMFKGYFGGATDEAVEFGGTEPLRLHSVELTKGAYVNQMLLRNVDLVEFDVEIQHLRRPNMRTDIAPRPDILLGLGDVVVLLGSQQGLVAAELYLLTGKTK